MPGTGRVVPVLFVLQYSFAFCYHVNFTVFCSLQDVLCLYVLLCIV